jgi:hypothetical protein
LPLLCWMSWSSLWENQSAKGSMAKYLDCMVDMRFLKVLISQFRHLSASNCDKEHYLYGKSSFGNRFTDAVRQFSFRFPDKQQWS